LCNRAQRTAKLPRDAHYLFEVKFFSTLDLARTPYDIAGFVAMLQRQQVSSAVVLRRRNGLRRIASTLIALRRGKYQMRPGDDPAVPRIKLPPKSVHLGQKYELNALLQAIDDEYAQLEAVLDRAGLPRCAIVYEYDVQADPKVGYCKICEFLQVAPVPIKPALQRINDLPLSEVIVNFAEVRGHLAGSRFEWMLTAD